MAACSFIFHLDLSKVGLSLLPSVFSVFTCGASVQGS